MKSRATIESPPSPEPPKETAVQMNPSVRPLSADDLPQVQEIERESFPGLWPPTPFRRELTNQAVAYLVAWLPKPPQPGAPDASASNGKVKPIIWRLVSSVKGLLPSGTRPESQDLIVGFVGVVFTVDEAHITSLAVRELWRGLGIGELLLISTIELALARGCRALSLEVRASNQVAQALYAKYGFRSVGVRKAYYNDNGEDAVIMTTDPIDSPAYKELFERQVRIYRQRRGERTVVLPEAAQRTRKA